MSDERGVLLADVLWERVVKTGDIPVRSVRVNVNGTAPIRRTLALEIEALPSLIPKNSSSSLAPYGAEIALHGGTLEDDDLTIASDTFARPNGPLGTAETGQSYRTYGAAWEIVDGDARMAYEAANPYGSAVIDCNTPNVRVDVRLRNVVNGGIALRVIDAYNLFSVRHIIGNDANAVLVMRWDGTATSGSGNTVWQWVTTETVTHLAAEISGARLTIFANDRKIGVYTLTVDDLAKYASGHAHGMWSGQPTASPNERFESLRIRHVGSSSSAQLYPGGVFRIDESRVRKSPDERSIFLEANDRSSSVEAGGFPRISTVQPGADIVGRIVAFLDQALPGIETNFEEEAFLAPRLLVWEEGDNPWTACRALAASVGMELFFDASGIAILRKVPSVVHTVPAANYYVGESHITSIERSYSAREGFNHFTVLGQTEANVPVRGEWKDDDPASPTYYGGPYGRWHAPTIRDPAVGSVIQANAAARGYGLRERGGTEEVEISALLDWQRDAGDVVRLRDEELGLDEFGVLDHVVFSRTPEQAGMTVTTAAKRTVVEEAGT